jgi:hypothetical protein
MVMTSLILAVALQAGIGQQGPSLRCSLASAAGDVIDFVASAGGEDRLRLVPESGSAWPVRGIVGAHAAGVRPDNFARSAFAFGDARHGVLFHLGAASANQDWRIATLYGRDGPYAGLPLAYGFCRQAEDGATSAEPGPSVVADGQVDVASFDSTRWRDGECALVALDGHRARFRYTVRSPTDFEFASEDAGIWNGATEHVDHRVTRDLAGGAPGAATLSSASGLVGIELTFAQMEPARLVQILQLHRLGGVGPLAGLPAFAVCGRSFPVRRRSN